MAQQYMKWILASRISGKGFTLLEMMVGISMTLTVSALALAALTNAQQGFSKDKNSIEGGQKLSSVLDIIGRDVVQAGEQVNEYKFPVVQVVPDTGKGSRLIVYRALEEVLPLCSEVAASATSVDKVTVSLKDGLSSCKGETGSTYSANVKSWSDRRVSSLNPNRVTAGAPATGKLTGVIHDGQGKVQLFTHLGEEQSDSYKTQRLTTTAFNNGTTVFPIGSTVYTVEKREYLICGTELKVRVNNKHEGTCVDTGALASSLASPFQTIATNIKKMDISVGIRDAQVATPTNSNPPDIVSELSENASFPDATHFWHDLQGVTIKITADNPDFGTGSSKTNIEASGRFYPRNILSSKSR
jgi:hypothetical protein